MLFFTEIVSKNSFPSKHIYATTKREERLRELERKGILSSWEEFWPQTNYFRDGCTGPDIQAQDKAVNVSRSEGADLLFYIGQLRLADTGLPLQDV